MEKKSIKTACITIGLAAAWAVPQANAAQAPDPYTFDVAISPAVTISNVYFLYSANTSGYYSVFTSSGKIADSINGGTSYTGEVTIDVGGKGPGNWGESIAYSMIGIYDEDGSGTIDENDGISIALVSDFGDYVIGNKNWSEVFNSNTYTESYMINLLMTNNTSELNSFFNQFANGDYWDGEGSYYRFPWLNSGSTLVSFSTGTNNGTAIANDGTIPEPSGLAALGAAFAGLFGLFRRRK